MDTNTTGERASTKSRLNLLGILAILILAPGISYIYLKKGIDYRQESLRALTPKEIDQATYDFIAPFLRKDGQAKLFHLADESTYAEQDLLQKIDARIIEEQYFEIIAINSAYDSWDNAHNLTKVDREVSYTGSYDFVLVDTADLIRSAYTMHHDLGKELIRHLSVVIPMQARKSIQLDRK